MDRRIACLHRSGIGVPKPASSIGAGSLGDCSCATSSDSASHATSYTSYNSFLVRCPYGAMVSSPKNTVPHPASCRQGLTLFMAYRLMLEVAE
jgi:hypothetical protein